MRRAKVHSAGTWESGGSGKLLYSVAGYSRQGFWKAYVAPRNIRAQPTALRIPRRLMPPDSCLQPENTTRYHEKVKSDTVKRLARECGFELAGVARAEPVQDDLARYQEWTAQGMAGEMRYLTDRRADVRRDPQN